MIQSNTFLNDVIGDVTNVQPLVVMKKGSVNTYMSTVNFEFDGNYYKPLLLNIPSIKESLDIESRNFKISSLTLTASNAMYKGDRLSDDFNNIMNAEVWIYYKTQNSESLADCLQVYYGKVRRVSHTESQVSIFVEDISQEKLHKKVPTRMADDDSFLSKHRNKPYPMVYGHVEKSPCIVSSSTSEGYGDEGEEHEEFVQAVVVDADLGDNGIYSLEPETINYGDRTILTSPLSVRVGDGYSPLYKKDAWDGAGETGEDNFHVKSDNTGFDFVSKYNITDDEFIPKNDTANNVGRVIFPRGVKEIKAVQHSGSAYTGEEFTFESGTDELGLVDELGWLYALTFSEHNFGELHWATYYSQWNEWNDNSGFYTTFIWKNLDYLYDNFIEWANVELPNVDGGDGFKIFEKLVITSDTGNKAYLNIGSYKYNAFNEALSSIDDTLEIYGLELDYIEWATTDGQFGSVTMLTHSQINQNDFDTIGNGNGGVELIAINRMDSTYYTSGDGIEAGELYPSGYIDFLYTNYTGEVFPANPVEDTYQETGEQVEGLVDSIDESLNLDRIKENNPNSFVKISGEYVHGHYEEPNNGSSNFGFLEIVHDDLPPGVAISDTDDDASQSDHYLLTKMSITGNTGEFQPIDSDGDPNKKLKNPIMAIYNQGGHTDIPYDLLEWWGQWFFGHKAATGGEGRFVVNTTNGNITPSLTKSGHFITNNDVNNVWQEEDDGVNYLNASPFEVNGLIIEHTATNYNIGFCPTEHITYNQDYPQVLPNAAIKIYFSQLIAKGEVPNLLSQEFFADVRGRDFDYNFGYAPYIISHILQYELNIENAINENNQNDQFVNAISVNSDIYYAFTQQKSIDSKKLIEDLCKSSRSFPLFRNDGKFSLISIADTYNDTSFGYAGLIKDSDIINYKFNRTKLEDVKTKVRVHYKIDYANDEYLEVTEYKTVSKSNSAVFQALYNYDSYGLNPNDEDSTLEFESAYIRDENSAIVLRDFLLNWYKHQHNILELDLPLKYLNLEVGDVVRFDKLVSGLKMYGEDYTQTQYRDGHVPSTGIPAIINTVLDFVSPDDLYLNHHVETAPLVHGEEYSVSFTINGDSAAGYFWLRAKNAHNDPLSQTVYEVTTYEQLDESNHNFTFTNLFTIGGEQVGKDFLYFQIGGDIPWTGTVSNIVVRQGNNPFNANPYYESPQGILPYFMVYDTTKNIDKVSMKLIQMHSTNNEPLAQSQYEKGDVNRDGVLTYSDWDDPGNDDTDRAIILSYALGVLGWELDDEQYWLADMDENGIVEMLDLIEFNLNIAQEDFGYEDVTTEPEPVNDIDSVYMGSYDEHSLHTDTSIEIPIGTFTISFTVTSREGEDNDDILYIKFRNPVQMQLQVSISLGNPSVGEHTFTETFTHNIMTSGNFSLKSANQGFGDAWKGQIENIEIFPV